MEVEPSVYVKALIVVSRTDGCIEILAQAEGVVDIGANTPGVAGSVGGSRAAVNVMDSCTVPDE